MESNGHPTLHYVDGLAVVGELYLIVPLNCMTPKERERVADVLSGVAADILKKEAHHQIFGLYIYE